MGILITQRSGPALFPATAKFPLPQGTPGSVTPGSYYDLATETTVLASSWNDWRVEDDNPIAALPLIVDNLTPGICDITDYPTVSRVISGVGEVRLSRGTVRRTISLDFRTLAGSGSSTVVTGFEVDTPGAYSWGVIEPLLIAGGDANLLSGGVPSGGNTNFSSATYNAGCWAADFDFTGVSHNQSLWNLPHMAGTLVTPRHALMASHYLPLVGTALTFIAADGTKHTRTITAYNSGNTFNGKFNVNPAITDMALAVLSSDLPETIAVYPMIGEWVFNDISATETVAAWIGVKLDQQRRVMLAGRADTHATVLTRITTTYEGVTITNARQWHGTDYGPALYLPEYLADYSSRYAQSIGGDSGSPRFFPLGGSSLALAGCVSADSGGCPFPSAQTLNAMILSADANAAVSTGYTVTVAPDPS